MKLSINLFIYRSCRLDCSSSFEELMEKWGEDSHLAAQDWFSRKKNSGNGQDPQAEFNMLDTMLKDNLERLKTMR